MQTNKFLLLFQTSWLITMAMNFPNLIEHLHELYYTRYRVQVFCSNTLPVTWWGVVCVDTVIGDKCYPCMWTCLCSLAIAQIICGILHALALLHELPQCAWLMLGPTEYALFLLIFFLHGNPFLSPIIHEIIS